MEVKITDKRKETQYKDDKKISIALMASFVILMLQYFVLVFFNLSGTNTASNIQLLSKGIVAIAFLYALPAVLKRSKVKFFALYFLAVFIVLLHYAIFVNNRPYIIDLLFPFLFMSLPGLIYALSIRDFSILKRIMKKSGNVVFIVGILLTFLIFSGRVSLGRYSMSLSYYMLLPTIMFVDDLLDNFSFKTMVFTILSMIAILALGSRGAILCVIVFVSLKFIKTSAKRSYAGVLGRFSLMGFALLSLIFLEQILMYVYNFLLRFGINSRTLILFLREDVHLSGRDRIYETVISEILKSPILGIGIGGDRKVLYGAYAHNIFIEIIANFGVILGATIIILILVYILKGLLQKNISDYSVVSMWISIGFVHLMVSSSYIIDLKFWIFLGVLLNITHINLQRKGRIL